MTRIRVYMTTELTDKQKEAIKRIAWHPVYYGARCALHKRILDQLVNKGLIKVGSSGLFDRWVHLTHAGIQAAKQIDPEYRAFQEEK